MSKHVPPLFVCAALAVAPALVAAPRPVPDAPTAALTQARAARDARQFDRAAAHYAAALRHDPVAQDAYLGAAVVEAERGYPHAALSRLQAAQSRWADQAEYWMAMAYVQRLAGNPRIATASYRRASQLDPARSDIHQEWFLALQEAGRPRAALRFAREHGLSLPPDRRTALEQDIVARDIRRGERGDSASTERALQALGASTPGTLPSSDLADAKGRRQAFDLMAALRDAERAADVLTVFAQIQSAGLATPPYALAAAADAHLMLRQPTRAEALYRQINEQDPANYQARVGLFYALVEQERFGEALATIDAALLDAERAAAGKPAPPSASPLLGTRIIAAMGRAYADRLPDAQRRLEVLPEQDSAAVATAQGTIYRWRGWPRQALSRHEQALAADPQAVDPAIGRIGALLDLDRDAEAEAELAKLATTHGKHRAVRAAQRDMALRQRPILALDVGRGRSSGGTFGSRELSIRSVAYGSPITSHLRPILTGLRQTARFREGWGTIERAGAGLDYRRDGWQARADLTAGWHDNGRVGASVQMGRWMDDQLWLGGTADYNSAEVPLRGQKAGVRGNRVQLASRYRFDERRRMGVSYDLSDFNDGNTRQAIAGFGEQRLVTESRYRLDARADVYASRNTERNTIYFNPERDAAGSITLDNRWRTWRRYENSFEQRLAITAGVYKQRGFGGAGTWTVEYGHRWRLGPRLELGYGVSRGRHTYDGDGENQTRFMLTLDARL
ncbi:MAG: poly-beta-1,6 N-acetyl-D-glucosamine export porin PgaA [Pseudomonadota bacterium]